MWQKFRLVTAGESHGASLTAILEGLPSHLPLSLDQIQSDLERRQRGLGRSGRMKLESDTVQILSGWHQGKTTGAPLTFSIANRDQSFLETKEPVTVPRPGHADFSGGLKYNEHDFTLIAERASARETACRVALGSAAKQFLACFGIQVVGRVLQIGSVESREEIPVEQWALRSRESELGCGDPEAEARMREAVKSAALSGETLGGRFVVSAFPLLPGFGNFSTWEKRLDARLAFALMSIPAIKGVEIGLGFASAGLVGSKVQDALYFESGKGFYRKTNRSGGIEGGISNGEPLWITCAMKPLPTLRAPLMSVDVVTKESQKAPVLRADITAVPSACVVGEAMVALVLADAWLEKLGGDSLEEVRQNYENYRRQVQCY